MKQCLKELEENRIVSGKGVENLMHMAQGGNGYAVRALWIVSSFAVWFDIYFLDAMYAERYLNCNIPSMNF